MDLVGVRPTVVPITPGVIPRKNTCSADDRKTRLAERFLSLNAEQQAVFTHAGWRRPGRAAVVAVRRQLSVELGLLDLGCFRDERKRCRTHRLQAYSLSRKHGVQQGDKRQHTGSQRRTEQKQKERQTVGKPIQPRLGYTKVSSRCGLVQIYDIPFPQFPTTNIPATTRHFPALKMRVVIVSLCRLFLAEREGHTFHSQMTTLTNGREPIKKTSNFI